MKGFMYINSISFHNLFSCLHLSLANRFEKKFLQITDDINTEIFAQIIEAKLNLA